MLELLPLYTLVELCITRVTSVNSFARELSPREGSVYIANHRQIVLLYHSSSVWIEIQDASSWDRNPPKFTGDLVSHYLAISATYVSPGIITHFVKAVVDLHLALSDTGIYIYIYIYTYMYIESYIYIYIYIYILKERERERERETVIVE